MQLDRNRENLHYPALIFIVLLFIILTTYGVFFQKPKSVSKIDKNINIVLKNHIYNKNGTEKAVYNF